jgi:hypothetical protein
MPGWWSIKEEEEDFYDFGPHLKFLIEGTF